MNNVPLPILLLVKLWAKIRGKKSPWKDRELHTRIKKKNALVSAIDIDSRKRFVVTTNPVYIDMGHGDRRIAGKFQIRIDFNRRFKAVEILNISQRAENLDSPVIRDTTPCWGTIGTEVQLLVAKQDLEGLIDTLTYYIASNKTSHGFSDWHSWFRWAKPTPRWFDFEDYDRGERQVRIIDDLRF